MSRQTDKPLSRSFGNQRNYAAEGLGLIRLLAPSH